MSFDDSARSTCVNGTPTHGLSLARTVPIFLLAAGAGAAAVRAHHLAAFGLHRANPWGEVVQRERCAARRCRSECEAFHL
jgi:hypothetical protein